MRVRTSSLTINKQTKPCTLGNGTILGTSVVMYRGADIGSECLIADLSSIREEVLVGDNTIIGRGVSIENCCHIGSFCKLETNAYITAFSEIQDYVFIAPGVVTSNDKYTARRINTNFKGVTIKKGGRLGAQATILPEIVINENGFAAAGSMVTKDIPQNVIYCGNPARYMKRVPIEEQIK